MTPRLKFEPGLTYATARDLRIVTLSLSEGVVFETAEMDTHLTWIGTIERYAEVIYVGTAKQKLGSTKGRNLHFRLVHPVNGVSDVLMDRCHVDAREKHSLKHHAQHEQLWTAKMRRLGHL